MEEIKKKIRADTVQSNNEELQAVLQIMHF
jgi:hypothetical protein